MGDTHAVDGLRLSKLAKVFERVCTGKSTLTRSNMLLFIESVYSQTDPSACLHKLINSKDKLALSALRSALQSDASPGFLNEHATNICLYLADPSLQLVRGGDYVSQVLAYILEPLIFWDGFTEAFISGVLTTEGQAAYAWLLLQVISAPAPPIKDTSSFLQIAQDDALLGRLISSPSPRARGYAQKIKEYLQPAEAAQGEYKAGGRHDNDHVDFRSISILPTADELESKEKPFLRGSSYLDDPDSMESRPATHLDNQFRLLREDMLGELREEIQIALGQKKGRHRGLVLEPLTFKGPFLPDAEGKGRIRKVGLMFEYEKDAALFKGVPQNVKQRKAHLDSNRNILKHQSLSCLIVDERIIAFPTLYRDEDLLAKIPCSIVIGIGPLDVTTKTLVALKDAKSIKLVQIDTSIFAYEPTLLALQELRGIPLQEEVLNWAPDMPLLSPPSMPARLVERLEIDPHQDLQPLLGLGKTVKLDGSQAQSLLSGLKQRLSLVQGPPGTGKSFIGALLAKALHEYTKQTILVMCYTNHALDQFLEDLLDIGIPPGSIVRLGGKSTEKTKQLNVYDQAKTTKRSQNDWAAADVVKSAAYGVLARASSVSEYFSSFTVSKRALMEYLEFDEEQFFEAFQMPETNSDMEVVGRKGKSVGPYYLLSQWMSGWGAGVMKGHDKVKAAADIWAMPEADREAIVARWSASILEEQAKIVASVFCQYDELLDQKAKILSRGTVTVMQEKRIIACTTSGAAKYRNDIKEVGPHVLLIEEAGEILESHLISTMSSSIEQVILIGDHQQLRPKVNNYELSVEKGSGYDLNRSLFERLVIKGYPHQSLTQQHRMRPEISKFVRQMTYPGLTDAQRTHGREDIRGLQSNIVFINHSHPEDGGQKDEKDRSRTNTYEADMVLKIVKYLGQQGYGTDDLVILTPYLGQLSMIRNKLKTTHDPVLNDLDTHDLVVAGLLSSATAKMSKKQIRLATIDNYQGEESRIVIASMTRSNAEKDIGFMHSPERLNVLLSRARDGLIMIGNSETFKGARKGQKIWKQFFDLIADGGHAFEGLPVKCERHPDRTSVIKKADDFEKESPNGGCLEPCDIMLNCGLHLCPSKCHQIVDHSKTRCDVIITSKCVNGHNITRACHKPVVSYCNTCEREKDRTERSRRQAAERQQKRDAEQAAHDAEVASLDAQIAEENKELRDKQLQKERLNALKQKQHDLEAAQRRNQNTPAQPPSTSSAASPDQPPSSSTKPSGFIDLISSIFSSSSNSEPASDSATSSIPAPAHSKHVGKRMEIKPSAAEDEWRRQKRVEGAHNEHVDKIMEMTGLEKVKQQVLDIKAELDVGLRQGTSMKDKILNIALLGNPGTGKTTIARHYAGFLTSVDVLPGSAFEETTGASLANDGVPGIKSLLEKLLTAGGGAIFVDEAYQLTDQHNPGGRSVLDYILTKMLDHVGQIVFIFAGYSKNMEAFFEANPGLPSRIPHQLHFEDYTDGELLTILENQITKKWKGSMAVEQGSRGLFPRVAIRRIGKRRGRPGFGNARDVANLLSQIAQRQARRITQEKKEGRLPDYFLLVKSDVIGPDPCGAFDSEAWKGLQKMTGLVDVKSSIRSLIDMIQTNYLRELKELEPIEVSFNRVFLGNPGTGKTSVAKLYGRILADLGLLSNGEVIVKNPSDFIGDVIGASEAKTKAILASSSGKVLVIDEAYGLYEKPGTSGSFKTSVIDTIVAEVQSTLGEDRCVLLLGYKDQMEEMFQNVNPGLSRRFAIEDAFNFTDFTSDQLAEILETKMKAQHLDATPIAKAVALEVLSRARVRPNFGNAGEVENMLGRAKGRFQTRQSRLPPKERSSDVLFEPEDFDPEHARAEQASENLDKLFEGMVGVDDVKKKLGDYQRAAERMKKRGMNYREETPTTFVFKGPPGTGKTSVARKIGKVFYDMGFLSTNDVIDCSASDLVGQYVGQTGPLVRKKFDEALGKVLFIDEAYRLGEGQFAKEAIDEIVDCLTKEKYQGRLIVILAGYEEDINTLLSVNRGLASRFTEEIVFQSLRPEQCIDLLRETLKKKNIVIDAEDKAGTTNYSQLLALCSGLTRMPGWGNARDIQTLAKKMTSRALIDAPAASPTEPIQLDHPFVVVHMKEMLSSLSERTTNMTPRISHHPNPPPMMHAPNVPPKIPTSRAPTSVASNSSRSSASRFKRKAADTKASDLVGRDPGVDDATWENLQHAKKAQERKDSELKDKIQREKEAEAATKKLEEEAHVQAQRADAEGRRKAEQLRIQAVNERAERATAAAEIARLQEVEKKERQVQQKLRTMGVCVAGFQWIKLGTGYRCAGGSHFISNAQLGM